MCVVVGEEECVCVCGGWGVCVCVCVSVMMVEEGECAGGVGGGHLL